MDLAFRQGRHRDRVEPRTWACQCAALVAGRLSRDDLCTRRSEASREPPIRCSGGLPPHPTNRPRRVGDRRDSDEGVQQVVTRTVEAFGGLDILVNNVGLGARRDDRRHQRCRVAGGHRSDPVSGHSCLTAGRAHMRRRGGGVDHHDRVDLGARVGRSDDLQRGEGRRDQPRQVDGAATGAGQHPRQQRGARVDFLSGWNVASSASRRIPRAWPSSSRRELPFGRFGRAEEVGGGRRLSGLAARELDQRGEYSRRRVPVPLADLKSPALPGRAIARNSVTLSPLDRPSPGWYDAASWLSVTAAKTTPP